VLPSELVAVPVNLKITLSPFVGQFKEPPLPEPGVILKVIPVPTSPPVES
jgi:hypothetical protein